ncbi:MAG: hypothetical protein KDI75_08385 [Xanthomonadales bacterium]|nr:hypothetical protein [Xanthomonadales bacterium]
MTFAFLGLLLCGPAPALNDAVAGNAKAARPVSPPVHSLQQALQKSGAASATKPAPPPRRPGPVIRIDASVGPDGRLQLHCDQHNALPTLDALPALPETGGRP